MIKWKLPTIDMKSIVRFDNLVIVGWFILLFLILVNYLYLVNYLLVIFLVYNVFFAIYFKTNPKFSVALIILNLFGGIYFYMYSRYNITSPRIFMMYLVGPQLLYLIGMILMSKFDTVMFRKLLLFIAFGFFTYGALNMVHYITIYGFDGDWRVAVEFWTGYDVVATLQGIYFTSISSLLFFNLVYLRIKKHFIIKTTMLLAIFFGLYSSVMLQNRTLFIITAVMLILMFFLEVVLSKGKLIKPTIIVLAFLGIIYYGYQSDWFGAKSYVEESQFYTRAIATIEQGLLNDPRIPVYELTYRQFWDYPLGGRRMDINGLDYAHNLWIDVLYIGGHVPFFLLSIYTILTMASVLRLLFGKRVPKEIKILYTSIYVGLLINFMTEPILDGVPYVFLIFCMMNGALSQYVKVNVPFRIRKIKGTTI